MNDVERLQDARRAKLLDARVRVKGVVYTWRTLADTGIVTGKFTRVEEYARRKVNLEYKKLASPKTYYCLRLDNGYYIEANKTVFEWFPVRYEG